MTTRTYEQVRVGMLLAAKDHRPEAIGGPRTHYDLWMVKSVRKLKNGDASVTLLRAIDCGSVEATARFPKGEVADPFRHYLPSRKDAQHIYECLDPKMSEAELDKRIRRIGKVPA